jgi:hypothetical protein
MEEQGVALNCFQSFSPRRSKRLSGKRPSKFTSKVDDCVSICFWFNISIYSGR